MKQELKILRDLLKGKRITPLSALRDYQCFRLGARIFDIRERGYKVQTKLITENGKTFAQYYLPPKFRKAA